MTGACGLCMDIGNASREMHDNADYHASKRPRSTPVFSALFHPLAAAAAHQCNAIRSDRPRSPLQSAASRTPPYRQPRCSRPGPPGRRWSWPPEPGRRRWPARFPGPGGWSHRSLLKQAAVCHPAARPFGPRRPQDGESTEGKAPRPRRWYHKAPGRRELSLDPARTRSEQWGPPQSARNALGGR